MLLLLAVSMQYSNTALGRKGRVWGIESLQGVQGVVSMDEAPLLHQAGEYTRGFTLGDESKRLEDEASSQRSRNFPVMLKVPACQCANAHVCAGVFVCLFGRGRVATAVVWGADADGGLVVLALRRWCAYGVCAVWLW